MPLCPVPYCPACILWNMSLTFAASLQSWLFNISGLKKCSFRLLCEACSNESGVGYSVVCLSLYKADGSLIPLCCSSHHHSGCLAFHLSKGVSCHYLKFTFSAFSTVSVSQPPSWLCFLVCPVFMFVCYFFFSFMNHGLAHWVFGAYQLMCLIRHTTTGVIM